MKAALFADSTLTELIILPEGSYEAINSLLEKFEPQKSILSSVIDHDVQIEKLAYIKNKISQTNSSHETSIHDRGW